MGISEKAIIIDKDILEYIPQRAPIVMVNEFYGIEENESCSGLKVTEGNIFCEDGVLSDGGIIEHIAQSAALRVGYAYKSRGEAVPLGFIGSVNKFVCERHPRVGEKLYTTITVETEVMGISLVGAKVESGGEKIAECKMKIFIEQ